MQCMNAPNDSKTLNEPVNHWTNLKTKLFYTLNSKRFNLIKFIKFTLIDHSSIYSEDNSKLTLVFFFFTDLRTFIEFLNLHLFIDLWELVALLNHWSCWLLHLWLFLNHWHLIHWFLNLWFLSGLDKSFEWCFHGSLHQYIIHCCLKLIM